MIFGWLRLQMRSARHAQILLAEKQREIDDLAIRLSRLEADIEPTLRRAERGNK